MKIKYIAVSVLAVVMASCGGKKTTDTSVGTDSADSIAMGLEAPAQNEMTLTADSIGPVHIGAPVASLPQAVDGLYDAVLPTETPDAMAYTFLLENVPQFTIFDFMNGKIDVITLEGPARGVTTPDGLLRVGDEFTKVFNLLGVESEWEALDDGGIWYWKWNGLYFGVAENDKMSEALADALCDGRHAPSAKLFSPEITIDYIGTGLPF